MKQPSFALHDHRIVALSGRDATAFAQAQFMNDVKSLAAGHWQWNGWLTPKGRVIALFALLKFDDESIWLLLRDADPAAFAAALQRFVFRSKVAIAVRDDLVVTGAYELAPADGPRLAMPGDDDVALDMSGAGGPRTLRISAAVHGSANDDALLARWIAFDLTHGLARLSASQSEQWTPQQLSLDRLHAYSVKKGCYPGQEIVARTHFLGQAKRGLALLQSPVALAPGDQIEQAGRTIGTVVSAVAAMRPIALAVLPLERDDDAPLLAGGHTLIVQPLLEGLAR